MKHLLLAFAPLLLLACSSSVDEPELEGPVGYDEATYYYWPTTDEPQIIYEIVQEETDHFTGEFPRISNLESPHPLLAAVNQAYETEVYKMQADQTQILAEYTNPADIPAGMLTWDYSIAWLGGNYHPKLWSLAFEVYNYGGGAHGNHWTDTYNYDPDTNQIVNLNDLFTGRQYEVPLAVAIGDGVIKEKQERWAPDAYDVTQDFFMEEVEFEGEQISRWVVAEEDGVKGLMFFFPPYDIGPYAEGGYTAFVPASVFSQWIKEEYKPVFDVLTDKDIVKPSAVSETDIISAGKTVLEHFKNQNFDALATDFVGDEGVWFSLSSYIEEREQTLSTAQIRNAATDDTLYLWGVGDGSGLPIEHTIAQHVEGYLNHKDFAAGQTFVNKTEPRATNCLNTMNKLAPEHQWVEFYLASEEEAGFDWKSLYLVFKPHNGRLDLVGVANHQWCI